jgi:hypothetical protein
MNALFELIKESNGDVLGLILFILLLIHFWYLDKHTYYTYFLALSCFAALVVDAVITYKTIEKL